MKEVIIVADAVNAKIDRIIKTLEKTDVNPNALPFIAILECIKIWDVTITTDNEIYVVFKDKEIMRLKIERDVIK